MKEFVNGAELIARAAIHAECDFFAGYPITPATPILLHMLKELPKVNGIAIQAEDEIASMGFCIGAAMSGSRVMTATSGPGISLYSENIGLAIMGEVPVVIVNVQRMGPATGGATTVAQGDIQFMRWSTSGGYPVIVLAPATASDCYSLTMKAFDLAERFRSPVFLAADKEVVSTHTTVDVDSYQTQAVRPRITPPIDRAFVPYRIENISKTPLMSHFGGPHTVRFTTSSHDEYGYLSKDPKEVGKLNQHLSAKINHHVDEISLIDFDHQEGAETLLISYGVTSGSVCEAVRNARNQGTKVSSLTVYSLWPVPERQIRNAIKGVKRVVVAELNNGQYCREIERLTKNGQEVIGVNRVDGELLSPKQILTEGMIH
jgi:2-oxoglutarate ferredoxin oxidoreductase subunit alpha